MNRNPWIASTKRHEPAVPMLPLVDPAGWYPDEIRNSNVWLYQRRDLPVRVVKKYENWRLIQDPDGAQGWMLVTMLSDRRTAIVKSGQPRPIRVGPYDGAKPQYMAEPGVVGRLLECRGAWCKVETSEVTGWMRRGDVWGVYPEETVP